MANKDLFISMLWGMIDMTVKDQEKLSKIKTFTKDGELIYELINDLMAKQDNGKSKYWIERLYGFIQQGALGMKEDELENIMKPMLSTIEKLVNQIKEKHKANTLSFGLTYHAGEIYVQIAKISPRKNGHFDFAVLENCTLRKAMFSIVNAIRSNSEFEPAWQNAINTIFPNFAIIEIQQVKDDEKETHQ